MPNDTDYALTFVDSSKSVDCLIENLALSEFTPFLGEYAVPRPTCWHLLGMT